MFIIYVCSILLALVLWVVVKWWRVRKFWEKKNVPFKPPHPIWGSLTFLQKENAALWMKRLYDEFKSDYVGMWVFWRPALVVNAPELARRVLVKDAHNFRNRYLSSGASDPIGALNIFTVNDPIWSNVRRRLTVVFTASKLRSLQDLIQSKAEDLVQRIKEDMKKGPEKLHLRALFTDYTTDVTGEAAFGLKSEATKTGDSVLRQVTRDFMKFSVFRGLSWSSIFFFPEAVDWFGFSFFPKDTIRLLKQVFDKMVELRGGFDKPVSETRDLLDALLKMRQEARLDNEEITEDLLLAQAAIFLQGGFDTSAAALTWVFYEIAHQPDIQDKLYDELQMMKKKHDTDKLDSNQLSAMPYMNAVIDEALRKYPPMGWLDRIATSDYQIDESLTIPAGTILYINAYGMHLDPQYFENPERFDPTRFLPENAHNIKPFTYMPFGDGPRNCIGKRFALQTLRFAIAAIVDNFTVEPLPCQPLPNQCRVEHKGMFLMPNEQMPLRFVQRA